MLSATWKSRLLPGRGAAREGGLWPTMAGTGLVVGYLLAAYYAVYKIVPRYLDADFNVYVAQPLIWGGLAVMAYGLWRRLPERPGFSWGMVGLALMVGLFQIAILVSAGVLYGFGYSPYSGQALNMAKNGLYISTMLLGLEMSRAYLLHAWSRVNVVAAFGAVVLLYMGVSIAPSQYTFFQGPDSAFEAAGSRVLPGTAESVMATFLASVGGPLPAFGYRLSVASFEWFSPILPNLEWTLVAFIGTLAPLTALLIVRGMLEESAEGEEEAKGFDVSAPWLIASMLIVALLWLNTGMLGVRPAVVSGVSMEPTMEAGDLVFTREVDPSSLKVGDIIRYRSGGRSILHRIIEVEPTSSGRVFVTQGDNNNTPDRPVLEGQIEGKIIVMIPKIGWSAVFAKNLLNWAF